MNKLAAVHRQAAHLGARAQHLEVHRQATLAEPKSGATAANSSHNSAAPAPAHQQAELVAQASASSSAERRAALQQAGEGHLGVFAAGLTAIRGQLG